MYVNQWKIMTYPSCLFLTFISSELFFYLLTTNIKIALKLFKIYRKVYHVIFTSTSTANHACFVIRRSRVQISFLETYVFTNCLIVFLTSMKYQKTPKTRQRPLAFLSFLIRHLLVLPYRVWHIFRYFIKSK